MRKGTGKHVRVPCQRTSVQVHTTVGFRVDGKKTIGLADGRGEGGNRRLDKEEVDGREERPGAARAEKESVSSHEKRASPRKKTKKKNSLLKEESSSKGKRRTIRQIKEKKSKHRRAGKKASASRASKIPYNFIYSKGEREIFV